MNQRIRELMDEAIEFRLDPDSKHYEAQVSPEELEMFAELIVRECAVICLEMSAKCAGLEGDGALAKDCAYWIKKDFGVEE